MILEFFLNLAFRPVFYIYSRWIRRKFQPRKYYFCICAIFKNEAPYLKEWIEYHKMLGVDHIWLYNNNSTDNFADVLEEYVKEGYVSLKNWEQQYAQAAAYNDCYLQHGNETMWLCFLDLDEFICPKYETDVKAFLKRYEGYPAVCFYWQMFGTGGQIKPDSSKLVIEQYTNAWDSLYGVSKYALCTQPMFRPTKVEIHYIFCRVRLFGITLKIPMITEWKHFVFFSQICKAPRSNTIQLNHYWSKSFSEYSSKMKRVSAAREENTNIRRTPAFFYFHENHNITNNMVIFRFLMRLKIRMYGLDERFK